MDVTIHRGMGQIGGNIVEISLKNTRILLDAGSELDEGANPKLPHINGLFSKYSYDAVFFTHNHLDHMGLAGRIHKEIPLYMGAGAFRVMEAAAKYKGQPIDFLCRNFQSGKRVSIGDLSVTPLLADHSGFDAYMFLVDDGCETVLYTGDFRATGRKSFDALLRRLPEQIDTLICEGTTLNRTADKTDTESVLEEQITELMRRKSGPIFILQAAMNIDRIVTMYRATKRANRLFLQELYMAEIASMAGETIPSPLTHSNVKTFIMRSYPKEHYRYKLFEKYESGKISRAKIVKERFAMCVRSSMGNYLKSLREKMSFSDGVLIYSMWDGYKRQPQVFEFLEFCKTSGLEIITFHTSGHADSKTITQLVRHVNPKKIIPIHTENAAWFEKNFHEIDIAQER